LLYLNLVLFRGGSVEIMGGSLIGCIKLLY